MNQTPSGATPEKKRPSRRRAPRNRTTAKRPASRTRKAGRGGFGFSSFKIRKSPRVVFFLVWLVALAALAGLVYWGKSSKPASQPKTNEAATKSLGTSPEKTFDHRETPKSGEARHPGTAPANGRHPNASLAEKQIPELREPIIPKPAPQPDSPRIHPDNLHASRMPEPGTTPPPAPRLPRLSSPRRLPGSPL
jgi:hypothetical protein